LPATGFAVAGQEAPGFAVFFGHDALRAAGVGIEADAFALAESFDGEDVPEIFGDDVADEEVDVGDGVDLAVGSGGFDAVAAVGVAGGGFDLDAEESVAEVDGGVVAVAVSPGDEDAEVEGGGAGEEGGLGGFSETLASGRSGGLEG
jgi:hypothetical protein